MIVFMRIRLVAACSPIVMALRPMGSPTLCLRPGQMHAALSTLGSPWLLRCIAHCTVRGTQLFVNRLIALSAPAVNSQGCVG